MFLNNFFQCIILQKFLWTRILQLSQPCRIFSPKNPEKIRNNSKTNNFILKTTKTIYLKRSSGHVEISCVNFNEICASNHKKFSLKPSVH